MVDILALLVAVVATAIVFRSFSQTAFWLMIPYAIWVSFASLLNFEIWRLNAGSVMRILITGATGYVGGQLLPKLLEADTKSRAW